MRSSLKWPSLVLLAAAGGCGEDIVPGDQTDRPVFSIKGAAVEAVDPSLRIAALWVDPFRFLDDWPSPPSLAAGTIEPTGAFKLDFFRPPPAAVMRRVPLPEDESVTAFSFALAEIVAFEDRDGDDGFQVNPLGAGSTIVAPDVYRGIAGNALDGYAIVYVERSRSSEDSRNVIPELDLILTLAPGYHAAYIGCASFMPTGTATPFPQDQGSIPVTLVPETSVFPEIRNCLHTHTLPPGP
jgi:hypothetical protein